MTFPARPVLDYKVWDNRENITFVSERSSGDVSFSLTDCKRRALSFRELAASGGAYTSQDQAWLVPVQIVPEGLTPKIADRITDTSGTTWTVLSSELNTWRTWYKLTTRNIVLVADLRDTINLLRPTITQDGSGNRVTSYSAVYSSIPCRVQEQGGSVDPVFGKLGSRTNYTIYLGQRVIVTNEDRVQFASKVLQIVSWERPDLITELMTLTCEELP